MSLSIGDQLRRRKPIVFQHMHHKGEELARSLGTFQLTMFGVGATVGTGIFFVLSESIPKAGAAVIISFIIAAVAAGLSALCYAEMASSIPVSGSTYSYTYHALGEGAAVLIAGCVLLEYGVAVSAVAVGWSGYFNELLHNLFGFTIPTALSLSFVPVPPDFEPTGGVINLPAMILILLCMLLLLRGAAESATVNAVMVLIKLGVLTLFIVIGFSAFNADHFANFFGTRPSRPTANRMRVCPYSVTRVTEKIETTAPAARIVPHIGLPVTSSRIFDSPASPAASEEKNSTGLAARPAVATST